MGEELCQACGEYEKDCECDVTRLLKENASLRESLKQAHRERDEAREANKYLRSAKPTFGDTDAEVARVGCGELIDQLRDPEGTAHIVRVKDIQMWVHREFATITSHLKRAKEMLGTEHEMSITEMGCPGKQGGCEVCAFLEDGKKNID